MKKKYDKFYLKFIFIFFFIYLLFLPLNLLSQQINYSSILVLSDYIEMFYPTSFILISQTGFYGIPDQIYFSFYGNNHEYNQFYLNGFNITSHFFPGTSLWDYYFGYSDVYLDPYDSEINGYLNLKPGLNIKTYFFFKGVNSYFPYTEDIVYFFAGHYSSIARDPVSLYDRRVLNYLFGFTLSYETEMISNSSFQFFLSFLNGQRTFLSFFKEDADNVSYDIINEDFTKFQFILFHDFNSNLKLFSALFYKFRTNYGSEFYFSSNQTKILNSFSLILGLSYKNDSVIHNLSLQIENNNLDSENNSYTKELIDLDGESMNIFLPDGLITDLSLNYSGKYNLLNNFLININSGTDISFYDADETNFTINLLYNNNPFGKINFITNDTFWITSNSKINFEYYYKNRFIDFNLNLIGGFSFLFVNDNDLNPLYFFYFDFNINLILFSDSDFNIILNAGKNTPALTSSLAKLLSSSYLSGEYFNASNINLFNTNGNINDVSEDLKIPSYLFLSVSFSYKNKYNFYFNIESQFRSFLNLLWTRASNPGSYSSYTFNDQTLYYISDPEISYVLTNFSEVINWLIDNGFISDDYFKDIPEFLRNPFYLGIVFSLGKKGKNFTINASFWAYMVVGITTIGNGLFEDEVGVVSENQADPNLFIYGLGRMISDRSYVFKFNVGFKIFDALWLSLIIKYRDGQPFTAFYESITPNNYLVIYNQYYPGDNPFTGQMGRREDCIWEFNLDISSDFYLFNIPWNLSFVIYNFFDLAFELVENVFNINHRQPLELQTPMIISFTISTNF